MGDLGDVNWFIGFSFLFWNREKLLNREVAKDAKVFFIRQDWRDITGCFIF